jgi:type I restriction enzyme R subunit
MLDLIRYRENLFCRSRPEALSDDDWRIHCWKLAFARTDHWLDSFPANRVLENPELARVVVQAMLYFAGERYDLLAYVVMPSHIHWLFQPLPQWVAALEVDPRSPRERITYSVNRFSATICNRVLQRKGPFWQTESYDHWVRDPDELDRVIRYVEENPVKAGLVGKAEHWRYSSAWARKVAALEWGLPIPKNVSGLES